MRFAVSLPWWGYVFAVASAITLAWLAAFGFYCWSQA